MQPAELIDALQLYHLPQVELTERPALNFERIFSKDEDSLEHGGATRPSMSVGKS